MKMLNKKLFVGLAAGAMIVAGSAMLLNVDIAQAAHHGQRPTAQQMQRPPQFNLNNAAAELAEKCNVSSSEIISYCNNGGDFREACQAARLAKLSGRSFNDVISAKTDDKNWPQVAEAMGISKEQIKADMDSELADRMAEKGNINASVAMQLLQEGYNPQDIEMAATLANASGKEVHDVLNMKKLNNRWGDIAKELGVDESVLRPEPLQNGQNGQDGQNSQNGPQGRPQGGPGHHGPDADRNCPGSDFDASFNQ